MASCLRCCSTPVYCSIHLVVQVSTVLSRPCECKELWHSAGQNIVLVLGVKCKFTINMFYCFQAELLQSWAVRRGTGRNQTLLSSCWLWLQHPAMDDNASLGKVSSSTESVATVTSEEFVLVQSSAAGSPQGSGGKPRLKVGTEKGLSFKLDKYVMLIPSGY